jgi:hypothetical protein
MPRQYLLINFLYNSDFGDCGHYYLALRRTQPRKVHCCVFRNFAISHHKFFSLGLPSTLQALANATAQHQQGATVAETPTPTKLIYPHTVTKAQEIFAEGFQQALRQIQFANNFVPPTPSLQSPSTANLLLPILAALTPTLSTAPSIVPVSSPLGSPVKPSVPAPTVSSETAQLPKPEQSQVPVPAQTASSGTFSVSSTSSAFGAVSPTATVASQQSPSVKSTESLTPSSDSSPLSEICKKLDPNTYMDFFTQHPELGAAPFTSFMHPHSAMGGQNLLHPGALATGISQHSPLPQHQPPTSVPHHASAGGNIHSVTHPLMVGVKTEPSMGMQNGFGGGIQANAGLSPSPHMSSMNASTSAAPYPTPTNTSSSQHYDPTDQERKKLERKRARNRMAASKCRQRKLERIQELEGQVQYERQRGASLQLEIENLQRNMRQMSEQIDRHKSAGCSINIPFKHAGQTL